MQIHEAVVSGTGIQMTQELCNTHASKAIEVIDNLKDGDAKESLKKLLNYLKS